MVPVGLNERLVDRPGPDDTGDTNREFYPTEETQDNGGGQRGQRRLRSGQNRKYKEQEKSLFRPEGGAVEPADPGPGAGRVKTTTTNI